jgi:Cu/Ag efflux pump CusA
MTAMAAGLALIPLAVGGGKQGSEIQTPMAIVILCGLTSSTLLNMLVVPTMYLRYARPRRVTQEQEFRQPTATEVPGQPAPFGLPPHPI